MRSKLFAFVLLCAGFGSLADVSAQRPRPKGDSSTVAGPAYQGEEVACDLPPSQQMKNIGSKLDGSGMCVFTSFEHMARWHGLTSFIGFRDWCATNYAGGGYPSKLDKLVQAYCKAKGIAVPSYVQYEGPNPEPLLTLCDKTGRMACITYGYGPRYPGTIAHMTNCPKYGGKFGVNLDNNFPETQGNTNTLEWMTPEELVKRIKHPSGSAWVVAMVAPSPPPVPHNQKSNVAQETHGPYFSMIAARERADKLRGQGWHCEVYSNGFLRWFVRASR